MLYKNQLLDFLWLISGKHLITTDNATINNKLPRKQHKNQVQRVRLHKGLFLYIVCIYRLRTQNPLNHTHPCMGWLEFLLHNWINLICYHKMGFWLNNHIHNSLIPFVYFDSISGVVFEYKLSNWIIDDNPTVKCRSQGRSRC